MSNVIVLGRKWHGQPTAGMADLVGIGSWWASKRSGHVVRVNRVRDGVVSTHDRPNCFCGLNLAAFLERYEPWAGAPPTWWRPAMRSHDEGYVSKRDKERMSNTRRLPTG